MTMPILPGFYPDPSVCRVGEWCYLASSTFEYVPGVPIHRSRDLLSWELVGHALPDPAAVDAEVGSGGASQGIFAPTLRHHGGLFWMTTTSIRSVERGQLIVHAEDPAGPWSEPVHVPDTVGIDPDLAWLEDGTCLLTWRGFVPPGIHQVEIDPATGERKGPSRLLWEGSGLADTEGPHLVERDGWWYLLVAEGGTHTGHGVSIARSRDPRGPFEGHPANPIFTHRSTDHVVRATGHPDLVELADGSWAMVYLGIRQAGSFPGFHVNGRETFVAGVDWVDGWPVVDEDRFDVPAPDMSWDDRFETEALHPRWVAPSFAPASIAETGEGLALVPSRDAGAEQRAVLCARVTDRSWEVALDPADGDVCLSVRIDADHWVGVELRAGVASMRAVSRPFDQVIGIAACEPGDRIVLAAAPLDGHFQMGVGPDAIRGFVDRAGERTGLGEIDGRYVSTEVAGGFTGRMIGVEALTGPARVARVSYTALAP